MSNPKMKITLEELRLTLVRRDERGFAAAAHLLAAVPFWGVLFLFCLLLYFRERSREIVFHIQQALGFSFVIYVLALLYLVVEVLFNVVNVIIEGLGDTLRSYNSSLMIALYIIYAIVCLYGVISVFIRKPFLYPVIGKFLLRGYLEKNIET